MKKTFLLTILLVSILILSGGCVNSDYNPDAQRDNQPWNEGSNTGGSYPGFSL